METTVLVAVSKRKLCVGAPAMVSMLTPCLFVFSLALGLHILPASLLAGAFHGVICLMTFKDRYFDQVFLAYVRRPRTKSLVKGKGNRYVGR